MMKREFDLFFAAASLSKSCDWDRINKVGNETYESDVAHSLGNSTGFERHLSCH
jgi:hypothetical protein